MMQFILSDDQINDINEIFPLNERNLYHQYYDIKNQRIVFLQENAKSVSSEAKHLLINSKEKIPLERDKKLDDFSQQICHEIIKKFEENKLEDVYQFYEENAKIKVLNHQKFLDQVTEMQNVISEVIKEKYGEINKLLGPGTIGISVMLSEVSAKKIVQKLFLDLDQPLRGNRRILMNKNVQKIGIHLTEAPVVGYLCILSYWGSSKSNFNYVFPKNQLDDHPWPTNYNQLMKQIVKEYLQDKYITHYKYLYSTDDETKKEELKEIEEKYSFEENAHQFGQESRTYQIITKKFIKRLIFFGRLNLEYGSIDWKNVIEITNKIYQDQCYDLRG